MIRGINQQLGGIQQSANVAGQVGQETQGILDKSQQDLQKAAQKFDADFKENMDEYHNYSQDLKDGHVDPDKFWTGDPKTGEGGHSKLMAGIGMILAGFNPTTNPNAAINFLKHQMDLNIRAQEKNLDSKNNLLAANLRHFGNLKDASEFTRIQLKEAAAQQIQKTAAKYQGPAAKAAADIAAGQLSREAADGAFKFSMMRAFTQDGDEGGDNEASLDHKVRAALVFNPSLGQDLQSKRVPGYNAFAKVPVPEPVREELAAHTNLQDQAQYLKDFIKKSASMKAALDPNLASFMRGPEYTKAQQMVQDLQSAIREGKLGTVYKEGEQPLLDKYVKSNPVSLLQSGEALNQLDEIMRSNAHHRSIVEKRVGLPSKAPTQPPGDANAPVKGKDGKMYIRQGNFMVPYKQ